MRIARLNVMIPDCPRCGYPILVDGFTGTVTCESCHNVIPIHNDQWRCLFHSAYEETSETCNEARRHLRIQIPGTFEIRCDAAGITTLPCAQCESGLDVQHIDPGAAELSCHDCGHKHPLVTLPERTRSDAAVFAIHTLTDEKDARLDQLAPIMMNCPNCNGTLKISEQNERITACEFCNGEFLIPDPLWKRLHPVKTAKPWFLLFDQPPPPSPEEIAEKNRKEAALEKERAAKKKIVDERTRIERAIDGLNSKISSEQSSFNVGTGVGYGLAAFLGIFIGGFPIMFITPLARKVGAWFCDGLFEVSVQYSGGSSNYNYYCTRNGISDNFDIFALYAILIGMATLCALWTLYFPFRYARLRSKVKLMESERNQLEESLYSNFQTG